MKIEIDNNTMTAVVVIALAAACITSMLGGCWMHENTNRLAIEKGIIVDRHDIDPCQKTTISPAIKAGGK